jgi:hypothetical protein
MTLTDGDAVQRGDAPRREKPEACRMKECVDGKVFHSSLKTARS